MKTHTELGHGFLEPVYQEAFELELIAAGIAYEREHAIPIKYKGKILTVRYRCDFQCFGEILVELKAIGQLTGVEEAQVINYLKATGLRRGLLINFGAPSLEYKRLVWGSADSPIAAPPRTQFNL